MKLSVLIQFLLGFLIGVTLLVAGAAGAAYLMFVRTAIAPPKPDFSEAQAVKQSPAEASTTTNTEEQAAPTPNPEEAATAPDPEEAPTDTSEPELPPGAYRARVSWPQGLSLRAEPTLESERVGGIGYNWEVLILEESSDKQWQKVQVPSSGQEGWVKAGNVEADGEN